MIRHPKFESYYCALNRSIVKVYPICIKRHLIVTKYHTNQYIIFQRNTDTMHTTLNQVFIVTLRHFLKIRDPSKNLYALIHLILSSNSMRLILLVNPFYKWVNQDKGKLNNFKLELDLSTLKKYHSWKYHMISLICGV